MTGSILRKPTASIATTRASATPCTCTANHDLSTGRKLLVVKDSYGNAMGPFLGASFDEVHVADFRYFEGDLPTYCTEHGITDVLFAVNEMAVNTEQHQNSIRAMFN